MRKRIMLNTAAKLTSRKQDVSIKIAESKFFLDRQERGSSEHTIAFYKRFFVKFYRFIESKGLTAESSIGELCSEGFQLGFIESLGEVNQQTINSYLRGYRAFGNFCAAAGLIESFSCRIKEVEPPLKQVYTNAELKKLLVKPDIKSGFAAWRNHAIINLLLSTGARANTIINIRIADVDLDEGNIIFNTTKAHKTVTLALPRKCRQVLVEYISIWRTGDTANGDDFLFCNEYGEQLTRGGLSKAVAKYNKSHGVDKSSIHLFRHTFAKNWITSGGDIITLSKVLTHTELDMVKRYANLYGTDIGKEMEEHAAITHIRSKGGQTLTTTKSRILK